MLTIAELKADIHIGVKATEAVNAYKATQDLSKALKETYFDAKKIPEEMSSVKDHALAITSASHGVTRGFVELQRALKAAGAEEHLLEANTLLWARAVTYSATQAERFAKALREAASLKPVDPPKPQSNQEDWKKQFDAYQAYRDKIRDLSHTGMFGTGGSGDTKMIKEVQQLGWTMKDTARKYEESAMQMIRDDAEMRAAAAARAAGAIAGNAAEVSSIQGVMAARNAHKTATGADTQSKLAHTMAMLGNAQSANADAAATKAAASARAAHTKATETATAAQNAFKDALRSLDTFIRAERFTGYSNTISGLGGSFMALGQYAAVASGPIGSLLSRLSAFGFVAQNGLGLPALVAGVSQLTLAFFTFGREAIRVEKTLSQVRELHLMIAKTVGEDGVRNYNDLIEVMQKYGLSLEGLSKPIARMKIAFQDTILGGDRFKSFMEDFGAVSSKFALPTEAIAGMAKAFEQMVSKGTVQAEEFRQQLGDRLPAAARVGLETFRSLTGNANASFKDFMDAMKNRQIESTRFLDVFMIKLKQMFGVTNEATNNLNSIYNRLTTTRDLAINNIDRAIGLTAMWGKVLTGVTGVLDVMGKHADIVGGVLIAAFGGTTVYSLIRLAGLFGGLIGPITLAGVKAAAFMGIMGGGQLLLAGYAVSQIIGHLGSLYRWVTSVISPVDELTKKLSSITLGKDVVENLKKVKDAGLTLTSATFKVRADVVGPDGNPLFTDPRTLIAEANRYFESVTAALRQGKKLVADFDFSIAFDAEIKKAEAAIERLSGVMASALGGKRMKQVMAAASDDTRAAILRDMEDQRRSSSERIQLATREARHRTDIYAQMMMEAQKGTAKQALNELMAHRASIARFTDLKDKFAEVQRQMAGMSTTSMKPPEMTPWERLKQLVWEWRGALQAAATVLGVIAAVNLGGLALGISGVGAALITLGGRLTLVRGQLMLLVAAATALSMIMPNTADAAIKGYDSMLAKTRALNEAIRQSNGEIADFGAATDAYRRAKDTAEAFRLKQIEIQEAMDNVNRKLDEASRMGDTRGWREKMLGLATPAQNMRVILEAEMERLKKSFADNADKIRVLQAELDKMVPALRASGALSADAAAELERLGIAGDESARKLPNIQGAIDLVNQRLGILRRDGLEALKVFDRIKALEGKYSTGSIDNSVAAGASEIERLARAEGTLATAMARAQSEQQKMIKMTREQAESIIAKNDAILEGMGKKNGAALKAMGKEVEEYARALRVLGASEDEVKQKTQELTEALKMQAAGINMAALQFRPYEALQNNFMKFSDSLVDLFGKGELNAKNFKKAFSDMAMSIASDMLKMIIKANILRPLMQSIWNMGGEGFMGGTAAMSMGNPFGSLFGFAKGGIFDRPVGLSMPGGASGVMAEAGPEAVMPLRRGADGSLGIQVVGGNGGGGSTYNVTYNVATPDVGGFKQSENQMAAMFSRMADRGRRNT